MISIRSRRSSPKAHAVSRRTARVITPRPRPRAPASSRCRIVSPRRSGGFQSSRAAGRSMHRRSAGGALCRFALARRLAGPLASVALAVGSEPASIGVSPGPDTSTTAGSSAPLLNRRRTDPSPTPSTGNSIGRLTDRLGQLTDLIADSIAAAEPGLGTVFCPFGPSNRKPGVPVNPSCPAWVSVWVSWASHLVLWRSWFHLSMSATPLLGHRLETVGHVPVLSPWFR